jgi:hypothetical protein
MPPINLYFNRVCVCDFGVVYEYGLNHLAALDTGVYFTRLKLARRCDALESRLPLS